MPDEAERNRGGLDQTLYNAIRAGDRDMAKVALDNGATMRARDAQTGRTVLFAIIDRMAEISDDSDEFGALTMMFLNAVTYGIDPNLRDNNGISPLNYTLQKGNYLVPDLLLATGGEPDEKFPQGGDTPLHVAVRLALEGKGIRLLNTLLTVEADPTVKNDAGVSAYDLVGKVAAKPGDEKTVRDMLSLSPRVKALAENARAAEQDRLRGKSKRPGLKLN